jgi:DHA2 family multidrug resistance protein-like MFS transporter
VSETGVRAGAREWAGLAVLALPALVIALDFSALHLAAPHLSADLAPTGTQLLWVIDVYGFMIAGLLIPMGTLGDRIGRRRLLLFGGAAFGAASLLAAFAPSAELLIAARALLGVTGATLMPSTLSLITTMFRDPVQRRLAIAVWSTSFMLGGAVGPLVGGALLEAFWWGAVFLPAVPVMLVLVVLGPFLIPEYRSDDAGRTDPLSVLLAMAALLPAVYGLKELAVSGAAAVPLGALALGGAAGWLFVRRQRRLAAPLLDLSLFAARGFSVSLGAQAMALFVLAAVQFFFLQYLQLVLGLSPLVAGAWTVPAMVAGIAANLLVPALARRFGPVAVITGALVAGAVGMVPVAAAGSVGPLAAAAGFVVVNLALNPAMVLTYDLVLASAPEERAGTASGTAETGNELGIALGVAIAGSAGAAVYRARMDGGALPEGIAGEAARAARETLGGAVAAAGDLPAGPAADLLAAARGAFLAGMAATAWGLAVVLVGLAVAVAVLLRERARPTERPEARAPEPAGNP